MIKIISNALDSDRKCLTHIYKANKWYDHGVFSLSENMSRCDHSPVPLIQYRIFIFSL